MTDLGSCARAIARGNDFLSQRMPTSRLPSAWRCQLVELLQARRKRSATSSGDASSCHLLVTVILLLSTAAPGREAPAGRRGKRLPAIVTQAPTMRSMVRLAQGMNRHSALLKPAV